MAIDEYSATWVSHSSISDFLKCPRAYYLRNVYKNPRTGHKMTIVTPPLALGQAVHEVIESLAILPVEERLKISLVKKLDPVWLKITGKRGGFKNHKEEIEYKQRGVQMLINLQENPGPILEKAIKIKSKMNLPHFWLNQDDGIILGGKMVNEPSQTPYAKKMIGQFASQILDQDIIAGPVKPGLYEIAYACKQRFAGSGLSVMIEFPVDHVKLTHVICHKYRQSHRLFH